MRETIVNQEYVSIWVLPNSETNLVCPIFMTRSSILLSTPQGNTTLYHTEAFLFNKCLTEWLLTWGLKLLEMKKQLLSQKEAEIHLERQRQAISISSPQTEFIYYFFLLISVIAGVPLIDKTNANHLLLCITNIL